MNVYQRFLEVQSEIKKFQEEKLELERQIYTKHMDEIKRVGVGTATIIEGDYMVKVVTRMNYKVDQAMAATLGGKVFRVTYELDKREFDKLDEEDKGLVEGALTTTPAKPSFTIIKGQENYENIKY